MTSPIWAMAHGSSSDAFLKHLSAEGQLCGLPLDHRSEMCRDGVALLVFDPDVAGLAEKVATLTKHSARRVIGLATSEVASCWQSLDAGLDDILPKATPGPELCTYLKLRFERMSRVSDVLSSDLVTRNLVGSSQVWRNALRRVTEAALFGTLPVLLTGESGTGKELCARLVQSLSDEGAARDLVVVDCTTLNPELSGSELFGHDRGAFTGAVARREGAFALADGGTLFLDEIGEMDRPLQAQLLRAIQEKRYKPVGSNSWKSTRFRLVTATNRSLAHEVAEGRFRADLFHRIAGCEITLPPLRARREDILDLVRHFLSDIADTPDEVMLDPLVQTALVGRDYAGNVRELQQVVRRIALSYPGIGPITPGMVPEDLRPDLGAAPKAPAFDRAVSHALGAEMSLKDIGREATDAAVRLALLRCDGNLQAAAKLLSVTPRALQLRQADKQQSQSV